jgi:hypothetical protein
MGNTSEAVPGFEEMERRAESVSAADLQFDEKDR